MARNVQCALAGFAVGGAALSLAYFGLIFIFMAMSVQLRALALADEASRRGRRGEAREPRPGYATPRGGNAGAATPVAYAARRSR
jgi:hypothetical protein